MSTVLGVQGLTVSQVSSADWAYWFILGSREHWSELAASTVNLFILADVWGAAEAASYDTFLKSGKLSAAHCSELRSVTMTSPTVCVLLWASGQCSSCDSCGDTAGSAASPHPRNHTSKCYTCQSISRGGVSVCSIHTGKPVKNTSPTHAGLPAQAPLRNFLVGNLEISCELSFLTTTAPCCSSNCRRAWKSRKTTVLLADFSTLDANASMIKVRPELVRFQPRSHLAEDLESGRTCPSHLFIQTKQTFRGK